MAEKESYIGISEFEELMKGKLKTSFEECIKDMRRQTRFFYTDIINESKKFDGTTKLFLIHTPTTIIFTARVKCNSEGCEINMVYTNPKFRGQGYCSKSIQKIVKKIRGKKIFLEVNKKNAAAISCYEKAGFVKTKTVGTADTMVYKKPGATRKKNK